MVKPNPPVPGPQYPVDNLDNPDEVVAAQDNAPGHKSEQIDGPPNVPGGDPKDLAKEEQKMEPGENKTVDKAGDTVKQTNYKKGK